MKKFKKSYINYRKNLQKPARTPKSDFVTLNIAMKNPVAKQKALLGSADKYYFFLKRVWKSI
jgi:hypothetical protein